MSDARVLSFSKKKNNRRKLLKEFYKLQESNKRELENLNAQNSELLLTADANISTSTVKNDELTLSNFDEYVRSHDFKTLISRENIITEQLNANQGEIKSIIYNNYYELIKISNYLENLKNGTDTSKKVDEQANGPANDDDEEEDDTTEFTIGVDDEEEKEDSTIKILDKIRDTIHSLKSQDLYI